MDGFGKTLLFTFALLGAACFAPRLAGPAFGSDFTAFAADETICRKAGTSAIGGRSGPSAAQHYDFAYAQCMAAQRRARRWGPSQAGTQAGGDGPGGNPHSFDFPDAFYAIPYGTPGYGYDGFGY